MPWSSNGALLLRFPIKSIALFKARTVHYELCKFLCASLNICMQIGTDMYAHIFVCMHHPATRRLRSYALRSAGILLDKATRNVNSLKCGSCKHLTSIFKPTYYTLFISDHVTTRVFMGYFYWSASVKADAKYLIFSNLIRAYFLPPS
jgi:hypothetical protein